MKTKQKSPSERFKRKVLMRWQWLAKRGVSLDQAAREIGVATADLQDLRARGPSARRAAPPRSHR